MFNDVRDTNGLRRVVPYKSESVGNATIFLHDEITRLSSENID